MARGAVVLLSGGLDSATTLALAAEAGYRTHALTVRYGQRHEAEVEAARRVASALQATEHLVVESDLRAFGGSALTGDFEVPKRRSPATMSGGVPITYVPARNTVLLSLALAWAEALRFSDIFIGVNAVDYSGYPDCRPDFISAFQKLARTATRPGVDTRAQDGNDGRRPFRIHAPLIDLSKADIIRRGLELGVDFSLTTSCYDPGEADVACGECDSCAIRLAGFRAAGTEDPIPYGKPSPE